MVRTLDRTKDIFLDTMLLGKEILVKKIKKSKKKGFHLRLPTQYNGTKISL